MHNTNLIITKESPVNHKYAVSQHILRLIHLPTGQGSKLIYTSRFLPLMLVLMVCGFNFLPTVQAASFAFQVNPNKVSAQVVQAFQGQNDVRIIVSFVDRVPSDAPSIAHAEGVQQTRSDVLSTLSTGDFQPYRDYSQLAAVAGVANPRAIAALQANPQVAYIQVDEPTHTHLAESVPALGADVVHNVYNLTGQNVRVAVLDTGIDTTHPDLQDSIVAQHCFSVGDGSGDCPHPPLPNKFRTLEGTSAEDENGHGSNVSGIITSNGVVSSVGFAPGAGIIAVRVLAGDGSGWSSDWLAGLNWIIANQSTLHVKIINMSLGTNVLYSGICDSYDPISASAIAQLHNLGITIFASSGNAASTFQLSSPACLSNVISVGATYDSNVGISPFYPTADCFDATTSLFTITCFTNSASNLDILAPGAPIISDDLDGGLSLDYGTSQASPSAAGVAALMLQAIPTLTPVQIEAVMKATGTSVLDPRNGLHFPLINALAAVQSFIPHVPTQLTPTSPTTNSRPIFSWTASAYATQYEMRLDQHNPPTTVVLSANATSYQPVLPLIVGTYYWQVRAFNSIQSSNWSAPQQLVVNSVTGAPPLRNYFTTLTPTLTWNRVTNAIRYELQVSLFNTFPGATIYHIDSGLSLTLPDPLVDAHVYYWRVRACTTAAETSCGAWTLPDTFVVDVP
jgi:subtilisin family serine protease